MAGEFEEYFLSSIHSNYFNQHEIERREFLLEKLNKSLKSYVGSKVCFKQFN